MLPHCLENGVKVFKQVSGVQHKITSLKLSKGVGLTESVRTCEAQYVVENKKNEDFKIAIEYNLTLCEDAKVEFVGIDLKEQEKTSGGLRFYFNLEPKQKLEFKIIETKVDVTEARLNGINWVNNNIILTHNPLSQNENILKCVAIQKEIDLNASEVSKLNSRLAEIEKERLGIREDLKAAEKCASTDRTDKWVSEIDEGKKESSKIQKELLPELTRQQMALSEKLAEELKGLSASWNAQNMVP